MRAVQLSSLEVRSRTVPSRREIRENGIKSNSPKENNQWFSDLVQMCST